MTTSRRAGFAVAILATLCAANAWAQEGPGLAAQYPNDVGLENDPNVLYFLDFDDEAETLAWANDLAGYGWTADPAHVYGGAGALEIQQTEGTHEPYEIAPAIEETDVAYVRWYRMWEPGYDFTQHKMPGVYAKVPGASGAGVPPTGYDKYSCKLFVDFERNPRFYSYNPDQAGIYGDELLMNLVDPVIQVEAGRWYCFEMMIKANDYPAYDGELMMWIDGQLVGHYEDLRFRDTNDLKINEFTYSAYVGGDWTSERDQKLWDDQIVVSRTYIGPLIPPSGVGGGGTGGAAAGGTGGTGTAGSGGQTMPDANPAAADADEGGCGCRLRPERPLGSAWLLVAAAGAVAVRRWRRRDPSEHGSA